MNGIWPIFIPAIDWTVLLKECQEAGINPAAPIAQARLPVEGPEALLQTIKNIAGGYYLELRHIHLGFLFSGTQNEVQILSLRSDLIISISEPIMPMNDVLAVISGTLDVWREAFVRLCKKGKPDETIRMFNHIQLYLDQARLWRLLELDKEAYGNKLFVIP